MRMRAKKHECNSVPDLIRAGILSIAGFPPQNFRNPEDIPFYTVPLIAEDYPAKTATMWNTVYEKLGIPDRNTMCVADPANVKLIADVFRRDPKYRGGGAGIGFKEVVIPCLDEITPRAKAIGAVNIIKKGAGGCLIGENTDGAGYVMALEAMFRKRGERLAGKKILMLGAGGSGRAIAFALADKKAEVTILNRAAERARELARRFNNHLGRRALTGGGRELIPEMLPKHDAVISVIDDASSPLDEYSTIGAMELPASAEAIAKNLAESEMLLRRTSTNVIISDIRIRGEETAMLRQARELGFAVLNGIPMVVNQGVQAFCWIHGGELSAKYIIRDEIAAIMREAAKTR